jgi:3-hydroxyacyl-[acyl-carrier-protein] dehydratase
VLDAAQIMKSLRQRPPFLMVDSVTELEPGRRVVSGKLVTGREEFFRGHFPGEPVFPGVMLIETAAQTAAFLYYDPARPDEELDVRLGVVKEMRFTRPVVPGDRLVITAEAVRFTPGSAAAKVTVQANGVPAASGELVFVRRVKQ